MRKLTQNDHDLFITLCTEFYASEAVLHPIPKAYFEHTFNEAVASDVYLDCYILEYEGEDAGYALLSKSFSPEAGGRIAFIEEVYVRPAYQGKGVGQRFFSVLEREYSDFARLRLEVEPDNHRAAALYTRLGFRELPYLQMVRDKPV